MGEAICNPDAKSRSDVRLRPDDRVAAVLQRGAACVRVFLERGMACPGCPMAGHETLADAAATYGLELERLIADLEAATPLFMAPGGVARSAS